MTSLAVIPTARVDFLTLVKYNLSVNYIFINICLQVVGVEEWAMFMRSLLPEVRKLVAEGLAWWFFGSFYLIVYASFVTIFIVFMFQKEVVVFCYVILRIYVQLSSS